MSQDSSSLSGNGFPTLRRRDMLRSAGALLAASSTGLGVADAQTAKEPDNESPATAAPALRKGMIAFTLAHEQFTVPQLVEIGAHADRSGFDVLATSDHFQPWQANERHAGEAWVTLGALGQHTRRAWMGTAVTCPTLRYNPAVVAEAFASLSLLSPGRIFLGLGSGEALNEQAATGKWPAWRERWDRLIEAVQIIRGLWSGTALEHKGTHFTVTGKLYDAPSKPIPILLAANGPKAMRLAGQHGDGLITDPQTWKQHKAEWQSGATAAGKDVANMPVMVEQFVVVGDEKDAQLPAQLWNFIPKAFKGYQNIQDPAEIQRRAQSELPLPKVYGDWTVSSDPKAHLQTIQSLLASGVTIVNIHSAQPDQKAVIDFYAKEVLPHAKARSAPAPA
jgi:F420-dependent hydroxymycolic acid dehydrogenase